MLYDACLTGLTAFAAFCAPRVLPVPLNSVAPSLGWFATMTILWNSSRLCSSIFLIIQAIASSQVYSQFGTSSPILRRVFFLPLLSSSLAAFSAFLLQHKHNYTVALISCIQLWSILGGLIVAACFPVSVLTALTPQSERDQVKARAVDLLTNGGFIVHTPSAEDSSGIVLDTITVMTKEPSDRWVLYCGGNGEFLETSVASFATFSTSLKANVILFNPRGVGRSTGYVWDMGNLADDAVAVVNYYVKHFNVNPKRLLLFGHSIGGGVVAKLGAERFPDSPVFIDRSFSKLSDAAVNFSPFSPEITRKIFPHLVGDLDSIGYWNQIQHNKKLVAFAKKDEIIVYSTSSLARLSQFSKGGGDEGKAIELHGRNVLSWHNSPLSVFEESEEILARLNSFLM